MIRIVALTAFILSAAILVDFYIQINKKYPVKDIYLEVKKGSTIKKVAEDLEKNGVIRSKTLFIIYSYLKNSSVRSGYYRFNGYLSIKDVWNILSEGREVLFPFTIIPGDDLIQIGKRLEKKGFIKKEIFYSFVFSKENVKKYALEGDSFEGYFPPETYYFRKNPDLKNIIKAFLEIYKTRYLPVLKNRKKDQFTDYQIMIIASLVEKETSLPEEKPVIAGVIINRLNKGMKLQIDPTVIYALKLKGQWKGNLTKKNMKINSPFNTYLYKGLPPTPISSFSLQTLKSVINYAKTDYLYFFTKDGKKHIFSKTYSEHLKKQRKK